MADLSKDQVIDIKSRGGNFFGVSLAGLDLSGLDLSGCDFRGADLSGCNLTGTKLHGSDFTRATLRSSRLRDADLSGAKLEKADLVAAYVTKANFSKANLAGADLDDTGGLMEATFDGADLTGAWTRSRMPVPVPDRPQARPKSEARKAGQSCGGTLSTTSFAARRAF